MLLQDHFIFRFGFILTVIFISLILVNPRRSFSGDATDIRKLAEQGYAEAQYVLGYMYDEGAGVPQDFKEAVRWYRKAAEQDTLWHKTYLETCMTTAKEEGFRRTIAKQSGGTIRQQNRDTLRHKIYL